MQLICKADCLTSCVLRDRGANTSTTIHLALPVIEGSVYSCGTTPCKGPIVHPVDKRWTGMENFWNDNWKEKIKVLGEKPVSVPYSSPQISHSFLWDRNRDCKLAGRRQISWTFARPSNWNNTFSFFFFNQALLSISVLCFSMTADEVAIMQSLRDPLLFRQRSAGNTGSHSQ